MEKIKNLILFVFLLIGISLNAQNTPEEKRAALLTPNYYTNWIGASFFTIPTIEKECDVEPVKIIDLTFFYDFGNCFVGMGANEIGVITQMNIRLFGAEAHKFILEALEYGYEKIGDGEDLNLRSNTGKIIPEIYDSNVSRYYKSTDNGIVLIDVSHSDEYANEYQISIYRVN